MESGRLPAGPGKAIAARDAEAPWEFSDDTAPDTVLAHSVESFCAAADLGRSLVYQEIAAGRIHAKKVGSRTIILHDEALRYLRALPDYRLRDMS